jgi:pimeloyl-ACP methyl ester carboxylesterase
MPQIDILPQLPHIRAQTLVITGDRDPVVPPEQSYQIATLIKGAELVVLHGAGHLLFVARAAE